MTITVEHISKKYKEKNALNDIQITLKDGVIYGLLGRNGAGKSTLLNILNNRIFPSSGTIKLNGQNITDNEASLNQLYLMSEDNLYPESLKIKEIFTTTEAFYGSFDWSLANKLCEDFQLEQKLAFRKLSTGYRSILKLIVALSVPAKYIFLDEPVLGLDANHRELFYQILLETYMETPRTFIISTHLIEEIANLIEEVIIIDQGKVLEQQTTEALKQTGATISGPKDIVLAFTKNMNVIGQDELGGLINVYVKDYQAESIPENVTVGPLNLQAYFVQLTNRTEKSL